MTGKKRKLSSLKKSTKLAEIGKYFSGDQHQLQGIAITALSVFILASFMIVGRSYNKLLAPPPKVQTFKETVAIDPPKKEISAEDAIKGVDTSNWQRYQNLWYGFSMKYPEDWSKPAVKSPTRGAKWEYRYLFRKNKNDDHTAFQGFDLVLYNSKNVKDFSSTDEVVPKNASLNEEQASPCGNIESRVVETDILPAKEIFIPQGDSCFQPGYFFSFARGQYIYNIVPAISKNFADPDLRSSIIKEYPEFIRAAAGLSLIEIKRPKPKPATRRITTPKPRAKTRKVGGKMVCGHKNDKPHKNVSKGKHLDMECCLDPGEIPNPWCSY